jgi:hypothetical protein
MYVSAGCGMRLATTGLSRPLDDSETFNYKSRVLLRSPLFLPKLSRRTPFVVVQEHAVLVELLNLSGMLDLT